MEGGLKHKECLKILYDQTNEILNDFKSKKLKLNLVLYSFFTQNYYEFIHNCIAILLCSISLFLTFNER